jgi:prepilin-type N-terminal cleavage/methylation domain-containing protein
LDFRFEIENLRFAMKKAFTLIEVVVAVGVLGMMVAFSSVIFRTGIDAYRLSGANAEILQNLRAITDQIDADFKGARFEYGGSVEFSWNGKVRSDGIVFFANGDFQSTGQHDDPNRTVVGNVASIYYGMADTGATEPKEKVLVRRQTILTADSPPDPNFFKEYYDKSLSEIWVDQKLWTLQDWREWTESRGLDSDLVTYMASGVDDFTVQYIGSEKPDQNKEFNDWRPDNTEASSWPEGGLYPRAFKFSFRLYDSRGVIENGREFSYIVRLEQRM